MLTPSAIRFPDEVRADLEAHRAGLAAETEQAFLVHARPCVAITAVRVSDRPLQRNPVARLFGARAAGPVLAATVSKFGGIPYTQGDDSWDGRQFLGQVDLAEATSVLAPQGPSLRGLLRLDLPAGDGLRARWFPDPSPDRALPAAVESVGKWETRLEFKLAWTLPEGNALEALWPLREPNWCEYDEFFPAGYNQDGRDEFHRLLGHKSSGLDEHYGFTAPDGCGADLDGYESLLRLTFDNTAGFAWGTNWIYLLVPREDLARGDLSRVVVTGANS